MTLEPITLVKYTLPEDSSTHIYNPHKDSLFMYLGEISNMNGFAYCNEVRTGRPCLLESEYLIPLTKGEI